MSAYQNGYEAAIQRLPSTENRYMGYGKLESEWQCGWEDGVKHIDSVNYEIHSKLKELKGFCDNIDSNHKDDFHFCVNRLSNLIDELKEMY